jgi:F-type H+-transporting ATPase subunit a
MQIHKLFFVKILLVVSICTSFAEQKKEPLDLSATLLEHISDGHEWHPLPFLKPIHLSPLSTGSVQIPFTQHILMMLIILIILFGVFIPAFSSRKILPGKTANILEPVIFFVRDSLVYPAMGREAGEKLLPFFLTLFFFILFSNLLGLIPAFSTVTGNFSITVALACIVFSVIFVHGFSKCGFIGFFKNMIPKGIPLPIGIFVFFLELFGLLIKNSVLAVRLFANMIAGHLVIGSLLVLIFIIHPLAAFVSVPMAVAISLLEVLVAFIQAMVFTMLSAIFIGMASSHH